MIYKVEIDYKKFSFDNVEDACIFAETAKRHSVNDVNVEIAFITDEECKKEEETND